jgi:two-component system, LuxR family, sensor kinase FixL
MPTNSRANVRKQSSFELQALLDAAVDAVMLIDSRGCLDVFNQAAERLFGYPAAEVLGRNVSILMTDIDRTQHDAYMERYHRTGVAHIIGSGREVDARRKDGSVFPAFLSVGRIANADPPRYVGFIQDLTLRQQAHAAVLRERDRANQYLEAAQTILVALDLERRVTMINRNGCEILGCAENALLGSDWFAAAVPAEQRDAAAARFSEFLVDAPHQPQYSEYQVRARDGAVRLIAWRYVAVQDAAGGVTGVLCSGDDVTDARHAEAQAREARERMMHVSRLATMGEMTTGISHELNQPLAAITTFAQAAARLLASAEPALGDVRDALEQIAAQALRAGEIIRRLRSLVRNRETHRELTGINELIEELGTLTRADARMQDVRVTLGLAADIPPVNIDRIQIQQVLLNLVRNAVQALESTDRQQREIAIETGVDSAGDVQVQVRDTGPGISAEFLPRLFLPFETTKADGTGLGLAISRSIVEAHKGRLEFSPNEPRGARFVVRLPSAKELRS